MIGQEGHEGQYPIAVRESSQSPRTTRTVLHLGRRIFETIRDTRLINAGEYYLLLDTYDAHGELQVQYSQTVQDYRMLLGQFHDTSKRAYVHTVEKHIGDTITRRREQHKDDDLAFIETTINHLAWNLAMLCLNNTADYNRFGVEFPFYMRVNTDGSTELSTYSNIDLTPSQIDELLNEARNTHKLGLSHTIVNFDNPALSYLIIPIGDVLNKERQYIIMPIQIGSIESSRLFKAPSPVSNFSYTDPTNLFKRAITIFLGHKERAQLNDKLYYMSVDGLSGLERRNSFFERIRKFIALGNADFSGYSGILVFDIDAFKAVNDKYGHGMGDKIIQIIGYALKVIQIYFQQNHQECSITRYGGEEFSLHLGNILDRSILDQTGTEFNMLLDIIWSIVTGRRIRETDRVYLTYRKYHETLESKIDTGNGIVIDGMEGIKTEFSLIKNMKDVPNGPDGYKSVTMAKPKTASIGAYFFPNTQLIPPGYEGECGTNPQLFGDRDFIKAFDTQLAHQIDKADIGMYLIKIFGGKNNIAVNTSLTDRRQISKSGTVFSFTRHNGIEATSFVIEVYPIGDNGRIAGEQKAVDALALKKSAWANGLLLGGMGMYIHEVQRVRTPGGSNQAVRIVDSVITPEGYIIDPNAQWEELLRSAKPEVKEKYSQTNSPV